MTGLLIHHRSLRHARLAMMYQRFGITRHCPPALAGARLQFEGMDVSAQSQGGIHT